MTEYNGYVNGFVKRNRNGKYEGSVEIDGVQMPDIEAVYFQKDGTNYLWLKRKPLLEYDFQTQSYTKRECKPKWEAYLKKEIDDGVVAYKGVFVFLRFKYSIVGVWDKVLGNENQRLNLFIERLPMNMQTIVNANKLRNEKERQPDTRRLERN